MLKAGILQAAASCGCSCHCAFPANEAPNQAAIEQPAPKPNAGGDVQSQAIAERQAAAEAKDTLDGVLAELRPWCLATFPLSTPASCAEHLRREVNELIADPENPGELADCLFLVVDAAQRAGVDIVQAAREKLAIVKARKWGDPDAQGVVEHIRSAEGSA